MKIRNNREQSVPLLSSFFHPSSILNIPFINLKLNNMDYFFIFSFIIQWYFFYLFSKLYYFKHSILREWYFLCSCFYWNKWNKWKTIAFEFGLKLGNGELWTKLKGCLKAHNTIKSLWQIIHFRYSASILKDSIKFNFLLQSYSIKLWVFQLARSKLSSRASAKKGKRKEGSKLFTNYQTLNYTCIIIFHQKKQHFSTPILLRYFNEKSFFWIPTTKKEPEKRKVIFNHHYLHIL